MLRRTGARLTALTAATAVVAGAALTLASPARAEGPSQITLAKTTSVGEVAPGETFTYRLEVGCSAVELGTGCTNATLVDPVPAQFEVLGVTVGAGLTADPPDVEDGLVSVVFTSSLADPPGAVGLPASASGFVFVEVRARSDIPFEQSGIPVDNTATLTATNQVAPASSTATVVQRVPRVLSATAAKSFDPRVASAAPGSTTTMSLSATNTSNSGVESIAISDPADPAATPNPFDLLAVTGLGTVGFPTGADRVRVDAFVAGVWVLGVPAPAAALPTGIDPDSVVGVRLVFTNSTGALLPVGATASAGVQLAQRDGVSGLSDPFPVRNDMRGAVTAGGDVASALAAETYQILPSAVLLGASKAIDPQAVVAGQSSTVTLGASNDSFTSLATLQIIEPASTTSDPFAAGFPAEVSFTGFTDAVLWPSGATAATVHYYYADLSDEILDAAARDTLPPPGTASRVVRFVIDFTGVMPPGETATVPFTVETAADATDDTLVLRNTVTVTGASAAGEVGEADAAADLTVYATRLSVSSGKSISPNQIRSAPGEFVIVQLPSQVDPFPESTTDARQIVVQDPPGTPPGATDWWNRFDVTAITQTAVPAGATLTVRYWNGAAWAALPGAAGIAGPEIFSLAIPEPLQESIEGLRFVFDSADSFAPGTTVQPNLSMELRAELRDGTGPAAGGDETVENCAAVAARAGTIIDQAVTASPCPTVTLVPGDLPGAEDFIGKTWVGSRVITARTEDQATIRLNWSTGGRASIDPMVISDTASPSTTAVADSVFDALDLVSLPAISVADDPLLTYDAVRSVELFDGEGWVRAQNDPCPDSCDGRFPGLTLTAAERANTIGVRLTVGESPTRADRSVGVPTAPPVGSGVARSIGNDRAMLMTLRLRADVRDPQTDPDPVLGTRSYNTVEPGAVENTASATGTSTVDGSTVTDTASDIIRILDVPLNVVVDKTWTGGPLGILPADTSPELYPSGRVTVRATNTTAANVDRLEIVEPSEGGATEPFEIFDLQRFVTISSPPGVTSTAVELTGADGTTGSFTRAQAFSLPQSYLSTVVSLRVVHEGRIDAGASASLTIDTRLRAERRSDGAPVTVADSPIANAATAGVSDEGGAPGGSPTATDVAEIALVGGTIDVAAGKVFSPATQVEGENGPAALTISGQPLGTVRAIDLAITDETGTFWNAFDFTGFAAPLSFAIPIDRVAIDACVGREWADTTLGCEADGGQWIPGAPVTSTAANASPLPTGVLPGDVEGLRFTFTRDDGTQFQNPADPVQQVLLGVQRRSELRSGGPVLTDLVGNAPAPGESEPGVFSNEVRVDVTGVLTDDGAPFIASETATAAMRYQHLTTAIDVQKSPSGVQQPGSTIPYTLTVTNTGQIAVTDPVITDRLPVDGEGPLLVFDPFADPGGPGPYSYTLEGAAPSPPSGGAMPVDPADVIATVGGDGAQLRFSFPAGTVLGVGQSYTIRIQLQFRPGLAAQTEVTNSFGVIGDRPIDDCGGVLDAGTGECTAQTTVTVQTAGALRGVKAVRAEDTELGVLETVPTIDCIPGADGFFRGPCLPVTKPGGTEIWRLGIVNTGTVPMNTLVAIDKLPTPGDTGLIVDLPRGSQWRPAYTGEAVLAEAPPGSTMTEFYSTDPAPCIDDLQPTGTLCPAATWTPWDDGVDPATVTALKFVVDFSTPLQPADSIAIDVTTRTPAYSPATGADTVAWNTVAVGGLVLIDSVPVSTAPTEGNKVGVALATGALSFVKEVTGDGAAFAPDEFTGAEQCVSAGEAVPPRPVTLIPGETVTIDDLPWGAECTVVEDDAGQSSSTSTTAVVDTEAEPGLVTVTNRYDLAGLVVTKRVQTAAVDENGDPVPYGPFAVEVDCTFLGGPVQADGPMSAELLDGESLELTGLPDRALCDVTETDARGASSTTVRVDDGAAVPGGFVSVELGADDATTVDFVNGFDVGSLVIEKTVDGPGAEAFGAGPFRFRIDCALDDESGSRPVWNGTVSLGGDDPLSATVEDVATGAVCDVDEVGTGGADSTVVAPGQVTIGVDSTVVVAAVNTFEVGALRIEKVRDGAGAELYGAGPFEVTANCLRLVDGLPVAVDIPGGATRELSAATGYAADYTLLPAGAACSLRETATGGATGSTILDADGAQSNLVVVPAGETANLSVVNTFLLGSIRVVKQLEGSTSRADEDATYTVRLACSRLVDGAPTALEIPGGRDRPVTVSSPAVYESLPVGARCVVTEPDAGGADATRITPAEGVVVAASAAAEMVVVNVFDPPTGLAVTGVEPVPTIVITALCLLVGLVLVSRRRKRG